MTTEIKETVKRDGYTVIEGVLQDANVVSLLEGIQRMEQSESLLLKQGRIFAIRNLLEAVPEVAALAHSSALREIVASILGKSYIAVRGILFDKIPEANWKVPWHQDVTIAVQERIETPGYGPWTVKAGVLHVQPPAAILEKMISVRLHLDPCDESNGALRVVPGSHRLGRIPEDEIPPLRARLGERVCAVGGGGALLLRPLLLHASSPSQSPAHRRVVHLDYAAAELPNGMRWFSEAAAAA